MSVGSSTASSLDVRTATVDDIVAIAALGSDVFRQTYGFSAPDDDIEVHIAAHFSEAAVQRDMALPNIDYLVAEEEGRCAGMIKLRQGDVPALVTAASAIEVQHLYVSPDFQRRGVGHLLMDAALGHCKERGIVGVWLSVWTEASWATAFYLRYGFRSLGEVAFKLAEQPYVDHLMWIEADPA